VLYDQDVGQIFTPGASVASVDVAAAAGPVGTPDQEVYESGDLACNLRLLAQDFKSSSSSVGDQLLKYARWIALALAVLVVFYVYERAKR